MAEFIRDRADRADRADRTERPSILKGSKGGPTKDARVSFVNASGEIVSSSRSNAASSSTIGGPVPTLQMCRLDQGGGCVSSTSETPSPVSHARSTEQPVEQPTEQPTEQAQFSVEDDVSEASTVELDRVSYSFRKTICCTMHPLEACCVAYERIGKAVDSVAFCCLTGLSYSLLLCCSQRVMMIGLSRRIETDADLRDEEIDSCLDACCCGVCRLPRWWCAYCCCVCDEVEDRMLHTTPFTSSARRSLQRTGVCLIIIGAMVVAYIATAGLLGLWVTCVGGQCAIG